MTSRYYSAVRSGTPRKLISLAVLVAAVAVGARLFEAQGRGPVPVEIHYLLGSPPAPPLEALEVRFTPEGGGPVVARFETRLTSGDVKQITRLPAGRHVMDITMTSRAGQRRSVSRSIEAIRGVKIRIDLSREAPE
jgi:hypothetical protein